MGDYSTQQDIFSLFDSKGDGKIEVSQVGNVLRAMAQNPTEAEIRKCVETFDAKDRISFEVFLPILKSISKKERYTLDQLVEGLRHFDVDGSGCISSAELRHLLTALGEKLTDDEVDQLMDGNLISDNGLINYESFVRNIMNE